MVATTNFETCILHAAYQLVRNGSNGGTKAIQFCLATTGSPQVRQAWEAPELPNMDPRHKFS
eukprot:13606022-Alexandrium_andersonii.AAC.1